MSALVLVILLCSIMDNTAALRPVVTFTPPWSKILTGDSVTLSCNVTSTGQEYSWYKNRIKIERNTEYFTIIGASIPVNGDYQCKTRNTDYSYGVRLNVSNAYVVLQAPYTIVEGEDLTLRCHSRPGYNVIRTVFYKDGEIIQSPDTNYLHFKRVNISISGTYKCARVLEFPEFNWTYSNQASVSIQDLFSYPIIRTSSDIVTEGDNLVISCDTTLNPLRPDTELLFAFYKKKQKLGNFTSSNKYTISAQLDDAREYSCEVKSSTDRVSKKSNVLEQEQMDSNSRDYTLQNIIRLSLSACLLIFASCIIFYHIKRDDTEPLDDAGL
ncbi:Fc receptor-like protein 5 [Discoglossus pictus]